MVLNEQAKVLLMVVTLLLPWSTRAFVLHCNTNQRAILGRHEGLVMTETRQGTGEISSVGCLVFSPCTQRWGKMQGEVQRKCDRVLPDLLCMVCRDIRIRLPLPLFEKLETFFAHDQIIVLSKHMI